MNTQASRKFDEAISQLSNSAAALLLSLPQDIRASAFEARLRIGQPIALTLPDGIYIPDNTNKVTRELLDECFMRICGGAVYSRQNEIATGCIILQGGHRAGICGRAVLDNGAIINITDISSLCIRIAHEVRGCASSLVSLADKGGIIIAGPPCSGKTTVLRDLALTLSAGRNTAMIDERGELAAVYHGVPQLSVGCCCDVVTGFAKAEGMLHAVRCLSPQVMICDEITTVAEAEAVGSAFNSGVTPIVSVHCGSEEELKRREQYKALIKTGAFRQLVILEHGTPGRIGRITAA